MDNSQGDQGDRGGQQGDQTAAGHGAGHGTGADQRAQGEGGRGSVGFRRYC